MTHEIAEIEKKYRHDRMPLFQQRDVIVKSISNSILIKSNIT